MLVAYVQDERYFAMEHMDVRREALQIYTSAKKSSRPALMLTIFQLKINPDRPKPSPPPIPPAIFSIILHMRIFTTSHQL